MVRIATALIALFIMAACSGGDSTPDPTATPDPTETATPEPTPTATAAALGSTPAADEGESYTEFTTEDGHFVTVRDVDSEPFEADDAVLGKIADAFEASTSADFTDGMAVLEVTGDMEGENFTVHITITGEITDEAVAAAAKQFAAEVDESTTKPVTPGASEDSPRSEASRYAQVVTIVYRELHCVPADAPDGEERERCDYNAETWTDAANKVIQVADDPDWTCGGFLCDGESDSALADLREYVADDSGSPKDRERALEAAGNDAALDWFEACGQEPPAGDIDPYREARKMIAGDGSC